jgi:glyoxylase I family protein
MKVHGIDHIVLRSDNASALISFYTDILGLTIERKQENIGLTQLRAGRSIIDILSFALPPHAPGAWSDDDKRQRVDHFALAVQADETELRQMLERHGIAIEQSGSRYGGQGEGFSIYIRDPERNLIELAMGPKPELADQ